MNGATAEPFASTARPPNTTITINTGSSQNFLRSRRNSQNSARNDKATAPRSASVASDGPASLRPSTRLRQPCGSPCERSSARQRGRRNAVRGEQRHEAAGDERVSARGPMAAVGTGVSLGAVERCRRNAFVAQKRLERGLVILQADEKLG